MKYENFYEFFLNLKTDNNEINSQWENISERKKKTSLNTFIILLVIDLIIVLLSRTNILFIIMPIIIINIFIYLIIYIFSGNKDIVQFNKEYKEKVIDELLNNFIDELDYIPLKGMPRQIYNEANYDNCYNIYESDDYFEGKINNQKIIMADLLVQERRTTTNSKGETETTTYTKFNGLLGKVELNKPINCNLKITRDYGISINNKDKLEMDASNFEKSFNVYSTNKIIGMQLLTADIQEDILDLYNKYKINFYININNDKMYVLFNTGSMFEVFSTKKSPKQVLEKYFEILKFVHKLVEKITKTIEDTQI